MRAHSGAMKGRFASHQDWFAPATRRRCGAETTIAIGNLFCNFRKSLERPLRSTWSSGSRQNARSLIPAKQPPILMLMICTFAENITGIRSGQPPFAAPLSASRRLFQKTLRLRSHGRGWPTLTRCCPSPATVILPNSGPGPGTRPTKRCGCRAS